MPESPTQTSRLAHAPDETGPAELAAHLAAKLCHDLIAPAGALTMGLDLLEDPDGADMREEALALIAANARKFVALLSFNRVALGASAGAATFESDELERLTRGFFADSPRVELDWAIAPAPLPKAVARALLNLAQIGAAAAATGGVVRLSVAAGEGETEVRLVAEGAKARLRPDTEAGLNGLPLEDRFAGHWVQAYYLNRLAAAEGGRISTAVDEGRVTVCVVVPQP